METNSIMLSMLRQGNTGDEILQILDAIASGDDDSLPTLENIEF